MTEFDLKRSLYLLKIFLTHPSAAFRDMSALPDVPGALLVMDALSFFTVVAAVVSGALEPTLSWGFVLRFIILYIMMLVVFSLLVGFEAGVATIGARICGKESSYAALYSAFGYAKLPLLIAAVLYVFAPERLALAALVLLREGSEGAGIIMKAFLYRAELFEAMALVLGVIGVRVVAGVTFLQGVGIVFLGWLLGTPIFYCVMNAIIK
ncbi:MAG TPA: hypothetical protein ENI12_04890 [Nitrospirae bacterium]|nr:hypothetical protein [Nitrospirota bacterium]